MTSRGPPSFRHPMTTHQLVRTEHLNQYGLLFGGQLLSWVDEAAGTAARLGFPGCEFVTAGMDEVAFRRAVGLGSILALETREVRRGTTSVSWKVSVAVAADPAPGRGNGARRGETVFTTVVTLVRIDADGRKLKLSAPPLRH